MRQVTLKSLLLPSVLGLLVLTPATGFAHGNVVYVPPPSTCGGDCATVLQAALDTCMKEHPNGCTVQLSAGTYLSQQLIAENFNGTLKGAGMGATVLQNVPTPLEITNPSYVFGAPPNRANKYPYLLLFEAGDITVSDMTFKVSGSDPVSPWGVYPFYPVQGGTFLLSLVGVFAYSGGAADIDFERVGYVGW